MVIAVVATALWPRPVVGAYTYDGVLASSPDKPAISAFDPRLYPPGG